MTIPLKIDVREYLDTVSADAKIIGAINTIVPSDGPSPSSRPQLLVGHNTDWRGMNLCLQNAGAQPSSIQSALIVGNGGTARAAIYALHAMGYTPLYLLGRSPEKLNSIIESFPPAYNIRPITTKGEAANIDTTTLTVAIGTIPVHTPIDKNMTAILADLFGNTIHTAAKPDMDQGQRPRRILLEMAYKQDVTPLMQMAKEGNWHTIPGLQVLAAQGVFQFGMWTGIAPQFKEALVGSPLSLPICNF